MSSPEAPEGGGASTAPLLRIERKTEVCGVSSTMCSARRATVIDVAAKTLEIHRCSAEGGPSRFGQNLGDTIEKRALTDAELKSLLDALGGVRVTKATELDGQDGRMEILALTTASGTLKMSPAHYCTFVDDVPWKVTQGMNALDDVLGYWTRM